LTLLVEEKPSPNADERPAGASIDCIVLHYTGMQTGEAALARLTDPAAKVSAHYLVEENGAVTRLVEEHRRAWHAGVSCWRGRERLNDCSIGIEIVNPGHAWGYRPFTEFQYQALEQLLPEIAHRWAIPRARILAHSDIAPERKEDPGELFDWRRLAAAGIGFWPEDGPGAPRSVATAQAQLQRIGYPVPTHGALDSATQKVVIAFQRRFRPASVDGDLDRQTFARLDGVLAWLSRTGEGGHTPRP
jgi:N-acetylmuramoyl-L-alanine amidase